MSPQLLKDAFIVVMSTHYFNRNIVSVKNKKQKNKEYALRIYTLLVKFYTYQEIFFPYFDFLSRFISKIF